MIFKIATATLLTSAIAFGYGITANKVQDFEDVRASYEPEVVCMADNIYHEARGEGQLGWELVRAVTNNRVSDKRWPKTVCVVVHQKWQFSWTNSGKAKILNQTKWLEIINHLDNTVSADFKGANHYHTLTVNPSWNKDMNKLGVVGNHVYYKG